MTFQQLLNGQMPQMVMFDLDGTLVDSVPDLASAIDRLLEDYSLSSVGESRVRQWVGNGAAKLVERALAYADLPTDEKALLLAVERFKYHYRSHCAVKTTLYPGVLECLKNLYDRQILMAIVTNKPAEFVPDILSFLSIDQFFVSVVGGNDLPTRKPSPEPLLYCLEQQGINPHQTVMVGDSRSDVLAARQAGISVAAVDYGYNHGNPISDENPDIVVSSLAELL